MYSAETWGMIAKLVLSSVSAVEHLKPFVTVVTNSDGKDGSGSIDDEADTTDDDSDW